MRREVDGECSIEDLLIFCSGASQIPPSGFDGYPSITFEREGILATASTCALQLRLPVSHGDRYIDFKEAMILSLKENDGFGGV